MVKSHWALLIQNTFHSLPRSRKTQTHILPAEWKINSRYQHHHHHDPYHHYSQFQDVNPVLNLVIRNKNYYVFQL